MVPPTERWLPTPSPDWHVSDQGRVSGLRGLLKPEMVHNGYLRVTVGTRPNRTRYRIHRLVLEAFIGPCPDGSEGAHVNGDRTDNRLCNLAWKTREEQHQDRIGHGTALTGEKHPLARLTTEDVAEIRQRSAQGARYADLAHEFGVTAGHVSSIIRGQYWS